MNGQSAVEFPGDCRVHIALAVRDLQRSRHFYETLFAERPTKERTDYVKFEPRDPSVNLTLNLVDHRTPLGTPATHYGIQVKSVDAVEQAIARLSAAGFDTRVEEQTTCCYAVQDKVWVIDPDGNEWEVFVVLQANAESGDAAQSDCCSNELPTVEKPACCDDAE